MKVAIRTIGCRANQADSGALARALDPRVTRIVEDPAGADLIVINSCCVTAEAERDCRKAARRALRAAPAARVVLTGCAVTAVPGLADGLAGRVELRGGGDREPEQLAAWINELAQSEGQPIEPSADAPGGRTRALLKVQSGCSHGCAYCIVPRARGPERSREPALVLAEVDRLAGGGCRELVLTGVQLGAWGVDLPGRPRLAELVVAVADRFAPGRVRLSSIEPWSVDAALIEAIAGHARICPHLHVPVQSGDDRILAAMRRGYRAADFRDLAERAAARIPDLALGTDVLCGFPGEDAPAFAATLALLEAVAPAYVHAFPYSSRPGTPSEALPPTPSRAVARARVGEARAFAARAAERFRLRQHGREREVIVEQLAGDRALGTTDNYLAVSLPAGGRLIGELVRVRLGDVGADGRLRATVI